MREIIKVLTSPFIPNHSTYWLTSLRGYAAVGVMLSHVGGCFSFLPAAVKNLFGHGKYGVALFFLVSAFSISASIDKKWDGYPSYITRRFFRIFPLYILTLLLCLLLGHASGWAVELGAKADWISFLMHISLFNLFNVKHANNFLGVEWTISIEFAYYFALPLMLVLCRKATNKLFWFVVGTTLLILIIPIKNLDTHKSLMIFWSFPIYAWIFSLGVLLFVKADKFRYQFKKLNISENLAVCIFIATILISYSCNLPASTLITVVMTAFLICALEGTGTLTRLIFRNKLMIFLGNVSFPLYLLHLAIFEFFQQFMDKNYWGLGVLTILTSIFIAYISHVAIELPFQKLGWRLSNSFAKKYKAQTLI